MMSESTPERRAKMGEHAAHLKLLHQLSEPSGACCDQQGGSPGRLRQKQVLPSPRAGPLNWVLMGSRAMFPTSLVSGSIMAEW